MGLISSNGFSCDASSNYSAFTFGPQFRDPVTMALIDTSSASGPAVDAWMVKTKFGNALLGQLCMRKGMPHRSAAAGAERHTEPAVIGPALKYTSYMHVDGPTARSHQMGQGLRCCKFGELKGSLLGLRPNRVWDASSSTTWCRR